MTIISIEGASAAGKTTTSAALSAQSGALHIPEVAALWEKPDQLYPEWFFERQVDRWHMAARHEQETQVIIDIDLFQPFWYNWSFDFTLFDGQSLDFVEAIGIESNVERIRSELPGCADDHRYSMGLFDFMVSWLRTNRAHP
ncbi:hypothetical protein [Paenibacillus sp. Z6-24]